MRDVFALHHLLNHVAIARLAAFGNGAPQAYPFLFSFALTRCTGQIFLLLFLQSLSASPRPSRLLSSVKIVTYASLSQARGRASLSTSVHRQLHHRNGYAIISAGAGWQSRRLAHSTLGAGVI
jgi:hypothetical protein